MNNKGYVHMQVRDITVNNTNKECHLKSKAIKASKTGHNFRIHLNS